jgi:succinyl-diaminopimelate desuccinylase
MPLLLRSDVAGWADLAIVMEPTANALEMGCLGNLNARVTVGGVAAHSARPWQGSNAIHVAIEALGPVWQAPVIEVELGGLIFKEVISVTTIEGGRAANVVPDLVTASVNYRYAPSRTPAEAESRVRELVFGPRVEVDVVGNAPPALPPSSSALVEALREAGNLEVRAKQAWTPVAEFASMGLDAVNFGPGDPSYAHRDDERVEEAAMLRSYEVLRAFLRATGSKEQT